jgi:hypothetical protein
MHEPYQNEPKLDFACASLASTALPKENWWKQILRAFKS